MFVAWRELRFARGRFVLIGAVVALITLLVGFLAGLTGGLASQNVSAVLQLPGERIVLQQPDNSEPSFSTSAISDHTVQAWQDASGVKTVTPIGIAQSRATAAADTSGDAGDSGGGSAASPDSASDSEPVGVALFGLPRGSAGDAAGDVAGDSAGDATSTDRERASANALVALTPQRDTEVALSAPAAKNLEAEVGDTISIAATDYTVSAIGDELWYSHTPVVVMTLDAWSAASERVGGAGDATVLAVTGNPEVDTDWQAISAETGTVANTQLESLTSLETFRSEIGSLGLMIAMLFGISALVVGAFFTVWTMQRAGDIAVLKALGATTSSLVKDALGQALIVLVAGVGVGLLAVLGLGALAAQALPFIVSPLTTLAPALVMAALGLAGAAFALRSVTNADPLTALGSNR